MRVSTPSSAQQGQYYVRPLGATPADDDHITDTDLMLSPHITLSPPTHAVPYSVRVIDLGAVAAAVARETARPAPASLDAALEDWRAHALLAMARPALLDRLDAAAAEDLLAPEADHDRA
jgi:hypothetical protein